MPLSNDKKNIDSLIIPNEQAASLEVNERVNSFCPYMRKKYESNGWVWYNNSFNRAYPATYLRNSW